MKNLLIRLAVLCPLLFVAQVYGAEAENAQTAGEISRKRQPTCS